MATLSEVPKIDTRPPGPKNGPFLAHLPAFRKDPLAFLQKMFDTYGEIVHFKLANQRAYLIVNPDHIKDILVTRQANFTKSRVLQKAKVFLGEGLLTSEGKKHTVQRRLVQPAFHRQRLAGYAAQMVECSLNTRNRWHDGEVKDIDHEMMRLTLAIVGKTLFSADVEHEATEIGEALTEILGLFNTAMLPYSDLLQKLPLPSTKRFQRARARLDETIYGIIAERRKSQEDRGDLLSMMLLAQDEEAGGGMDDKQVRDEAMTLFLAGHETTANALTWTWYLLSQHPQVESRMQAEIDALGGRTPSMDDLPQLKYVEAVFAEAMRMYPPAWAVGRMSIESFELGGHLIPAKAILLLSPYVMQRHPDYFPNPTHFDPERWAAGEAEKRPKFSYFPFGGGARVCIGERFAWMEGVLAIAAIAQKWKLKLVPGHPVETKALITLRPKHGMRMTVHARQ